MRARAISLPIALALLAACDSPKGAAATATERPSAHGAPTTAASNSVPAALPARDAGAPSSALQLAGSWAGSFQARKGTLSVPAGRPTATWDDDKGQLAMGEGRVELTIGEDGLVQGSAQGSLGALVARGMVDETTVRAGLSPRDPLAEPAMSGLLLGAFDGTKLTVEIRVSSENGALARVAKLELRRTAGR